MWAHHGYYIKKQTQWYSNDSSSFSHRDNNMRNIFLEKSYTKPGGETIPRPFSKKSKLSVSLEQ